MLTTWFWFNVDIVLTNVLTLFQHLSTLKQRAVFAGLLLLKCSCSHNWDNCNRCVNLRQCFLSLSKMYIGVMGKGRFQAGRAKWVWEASLKCDTFYWTVHQSRSHRQLYFPIGIYLVTYTPIYNLEYYGYMRICRSSCHSFNFVNMR